MLCHKVATFIFSFALCRRSGRRLTFPLREGGGSAWSLQKSSSGFEAAL